MAVTHEVMSEPADDGRLNDTDQAILELLQDGRETTGSLSDNLDKHPQTIRDRLKWLREWGYVRYYHDSTGLHESTDAVESEEGTTLSIDDDMNQMDRWILEFFHQHQWATPNLIRARYNDEQDSEDDRVTRQWVSSRMKGLQEGGYIEKVHANSDEYQLVDGPRD